MGFRGMAVHLERARRCRDTFLSEVQNNLRKCEEEMPDLIFVCRNDLQVLAHRTVIGALSPLIRAMLGDLGHLDLVTIHLSDFAKPSLESLFHRLRGKGDEQLSSEELDLMAALGVAFDLNGSPNASLVPESPSTVGTKISTGASEESPDTKMEEDKQSETSDFKASLKAALASTCKVSDNAENLRQGKKQKDRKLKDNPKAVQYKEKSHGNNKHKP